MKLSLRVGHRDGVHRESDSARRDSDRDSARLSRHGAPGPRTCQDSPGRRAAGLGPRRAGAACGCPPASLRRASSSRCAARRPGRMFKSPSTEPSLSESRRPGPPAGGPTSGTFRLGHCCIALFLAICHLGYIAPAKLLYSKGAISIFCYSNMLYSHSVTEGGI